VGRGICRSGLKFMLITDTQSHDRRTILTIFVSLLVPGRVRAGVLWLLRLLAVEHLVEELKLRRDWEDEDQQSADQGL